MQPTEPSIGNKSTCQLCGKPITFLGCFWKHDDGKPRHIAKPRIQEPAERGEEGGEPPKC